MAPVLTESKKMTLQELKYFQRRIVEPFPPSIVATVLQKYSDAESILANMRRAERIALGPRLPDNPILSPKGK